MTDAVSSSGDRRRHTRQHEEILCPVSFVIAGERHSAYVIDLSISGLQMKQYDDRANPGVMPGTCVEYLIYTSAGQSAFTGMTQWMREDGDGFRWGARFTRLPSAINDPLLSIIYASPAR
jgi:hypothetical protein